MSFDTDDGKRSNFGVVASLLDIGNGQSRLIMDDVRAQHPVRETSWDFGLFFTHQTHENSVLDRMALSDDAYRDIGAALVARRPAIIEDKERVGSEAPPISVTPLYPPLQGTCSRGMQSP